VPTSVEKSATSTAICSEIWVPRITCANWSLPAASVPNGWASDGGSDLSGVNSPKSYCQSAPPT
jgi:hypothetical protein